MASKGILAKIFDVFPKKIPLLTACLFLTRCPLFSGKRSGHSHGNPSTAHLSAPAGRQLYGPDGLLPVRTFLARQGTGVGPGLGNLVAYHDPAPACVKRLWAWAWGKGAT